MTDYLEDRNIPLNLSVFMEGQELKDLLAFFRGPDPGGGADHKRG